jgi:hypothetical protein
MKIFASLALICLLHSVAQAKSLVKTDYGQLIVEQLAMRFRFPDRYMDSDRGEPAPKDMAFAEMVRRGLLRIGTTKVEVEFLLGPAEFPSGAGTAVTQLNFGMMGGGLTIVLDQHGTVSAAHVHHDGDPDHAHIEEIPLKPGKQTLPP